ncbi:MAG: hypothetical protein WKF46_09630, partial [Candidatus Limnocylindrales bacterium]
MVIRAPSDRSIDGPEKTAGDTTDSAGGRIAGRQAGRGDEGEAPGVGGQESAERIRRSFAENWGEMGAAWGVQPSVARVH